MPVIHSSQASVTLLRRPPTIEICLPYNTDHFLKSCPRQRKMYMQFLDPSFPEVARSRLGYTYGIHYVPTVRHGKPANRYVYEGPSKPEHMMHSLVTIVDGKRGSSARRW